MISNLSDVSLALAVWAIHDEYDFIDDPNYISVTKLMKPIRHLVLPPRVPAEKRQIDVMDLVASALGKSLHDSVEKAWVKGYARSLKMLGYPEDVIKRVVVNPSSEILKANPNCIPIYLEQREIREIAGKKVGGKFDMIADGILQDLKTTTAYTWKFGGKDDDYILQGSLYRWLNQEKVTEDFIRINFIFTDWQKAMARSDPEYPQSRVLSKEYKLWSVTKTEQWIINKIAQIERNMNLPDAQIPECTDEELWRSDPQFRYYADPEKAKVAGARSSRNFETKAEAMVYWKQDKGGKGIVIEKPGEVKRCDYCDAAPICQQRRKYIND